MSKKSVIAWIWIVLIAVSAVVPPLRNGSYFRGYGLLFSPGSLRVDFERLFMEWVILSVLAGGLYFAWPCKEKP
jgi:hypothetical protein